MFLKNNLLLGLTGNIGCGKTTASNYLSNNSNGWSFTEYSFAKPLKEIAIIMGFKYQEIYGTQQDKTEINDFWGISGREFLQKFGTEICRDILPTVILNMNLKSQSLWVRLFELFYETYKKEKSIVVSDVRFTDEFDTIKKLGGYIIKIERTQNNANNTFSNHKSETGLNNIKPNVVIKNDCSLQDFQKKIDSVIYYANTGFLDIPNSTLYL